MKKAITILVIIALVLALIAAGFGGYIWYKTTHIFVDGDAYPIKSTSLDLREQDISLRYYDQLHDQAPHCGILWNVPFQGGRVQSDAKEVTMTTVSKEEVAVLSYFPNLKTVGAVACRDYPGLEALQAQRPDLDVRYQVDLGGAALDPKTDKAELNRGEYTFDALMENLKYLHSLQTLTFRMPELSLEQVEKLKAAYDGLEILCTVELRGQELSTDTATLDLTSLSASEVSAVAEKLALFAEASGGEAVR